MSEKRSVISEKTLVPLSFIITLAGGIYWLSSMQFAAAQNKDDVAELKESEQHLHDSLSRILEKQNDDLVELKSQVSAIDAKIQILVRYARGYEPSDPKQH